MSRAATMDTQMRWAEDRDKISRQSKLYGALRPQQLKWYLNNQHLHGKITAFELDYWLRYFNVDPSL